MDRYSRQTVLKEVGEEGQKRIGHGTAVIIGLGGLGSVTADALVRCGVGNIKLIDRDFVELSNLQRQTVYTEEDIGKPKAEVMYDHLKKVNSNVELETLVIDVNKNNIEDMITGADVVMDCTDNMKTRYIINDACIKHNIPWIYTAILGTYGMTMDIIPGKGPCLRCLLPKKPRVGSMETCATAGVLFSIPRIMANVASTEAVKMLMGVEIRKEMLTMDLWKNEYELMTISRNDECPCCEKHEFKYLEEEEDLAVELCGRNSVQVSPGDEIQLDLKAIANRYPRSKLMGKSMLKIPSEKHELNLFSDGRLIVKGTDDVKKAKALYSEYVGR